MQSKSYHINSTDGHKIFVRSWLPNQTQPPKAFVHLLHGMAEHSERYAYIAEKFNQIGIAVVAHDHRGHGFSANVSSLTLGHFADSQGWQKVIKDVALVQVDIKKRFPKQPIILLGHSMGSFIALQHATCYPKSAAAIILSGTLMSPRHMLRLARWTSLILSTFTGKKRRNILVDFMTFRNSEQAFKPQRTKRDWLTKRRDIVDAYMSDARCGFVASNQCWVDLTTALLKLWKQKTLKKLPKDIPYYCFAGSQDPLANFGQDFLRAMAALKTAGITNLTVKTYDEDRHEPLNELDRDQVIDDMLSWLTNHLNLTPVKQPEEALACV